MKETGIIMSGDHPLKCLDGTKTMTRRVIVPQPLLGQEIHKTMNPNVWAVLEMAEKPVDRLRNITCPYGGVGDRLWVRETYCFDVLDDPFSPSEIHQMYGDRMRCYLLDRHFSGIVIPHFRDGRIRSPRFMPRWASRILLEITEVRAERLQEITEEDAIAEGCQLIAKSIQHFELKPTPHFTEPERPFTHRDHFIGLWDSINAERGYGWEVNPWVWPIGFKLVGKNEI